MATKLPPISLVRKFPSLILASVMVPSVEEKGGGAKEEKSDGELFRKKSPLR